MATFTIFDEALNNIGINLIDLDSHTFKAMLTNVAPNQGTAGVKASITEIATGNGYTAGGATLASTTFTETGSGTGVWRFNATSPVFTASGGNIATHQYMVVYSDTASNDELVGYVDQGTSTVIATGNSRTWTISAGLFDVDATP